MVLQQLKWLVEKSFNISIWRTLPHGIDAFKDIKRLFPSYKLEIVFDIGANVGQSAVGFVKEFPLAKIFSFEPSSGIFDKLKTNTSGIPNVRIFKLAFSDAPGEMKMTTKRNSKRNRLYDETEVGDIATEIVKVETVDSFCEDHKISRINYLKIDTEGNDLKVLSSAISMLAKQAVDFIEVEVGMNKTNKFHVPAFQMQDFLEAKNYHLLGIYEQVHEWKTGKHLLRRTNQVYVSANLIGISG